MEEKKIEGRGGRRPGAGRPKGTLRGIKHPYKKVSLAFEESDKEAIKKLAEESGKTFSRFVADKVLGRV